MVVCYGGTLAVVYLVENKSMGGEPGLSPLVGPRRTLLPWRLRLRLAFLFSIWLVCPAFWSGRSVVVFNPGERGDCKEIPRMGDTAANVLVIRDEKLRLGKLCDSKSLGKDCFPQKMLGRRGRPSGRSHSLTNSRRPFSQRN